MKRIDVKRAAPRDEEDYSQQAEVIEMDPEPENDNTRFALNWVLELNEKYRTTIERLNSVHGRIASLDNENRRALDFIKFNVEDNE